MNNNEQTHKLVTHTRLQILLYAASHIHATDHFVQWSKNNTFKARQMVTVLWLFFGVNPY